MEKKLKAVKSQELGEIYQVVKEFINFLTKEYKEIEKLKEEK